MSVAVLSSPQDKYTAPADAAQLYAWDKDYVHALARRHLGSDRPCDVEDVAADIMEKMVARNVPGMYRGDVISTHTRQRVTWRAFLSAQVMLYMRGKREEYGKRRGRELMLMDSVVGASGTTWAELHGETTTDEYPSDAEDYQRLRDWLATQPPAPGPCSLLLLFDELSALVAAGENPGPALAARRLSITRVQAEQAMDQLRAALRELPATGEPPVFEVLGQTLSGSQVAAAANALRSSRGNRVSPALAAIGHPLARVTTPEWIAFGRAEVKAYPETRVPRGGHAAHNSQTKVAIIHRLERMLTEAAVPPEPEEPETLREFMEARLWHIKGLEPDQVDAILDIAESVYSGA